MKQPLINKLVNYGLWQGAANFYAEFKNDELHIDYDETSADDLILTEQTAKKFSSELSNILKTDNLASGNDMSWRLETSEGIKTIIITAIASENKKYLVQVLNSGSKAMTLGQLGLHHFTLKNLKEHLAKDLTGLIIVSSPEQAGRSNSLRALVNEVSKVKENILSLEPVAGLDILSLPLNSNWLESHSTSEIVNQIKNQQADTILSDHVENLETLKALIELSQQGRLIIMTLPANNSQEAWKKITDIYPKRKLEENLNFVLSQQLMNRLCPHCLSKAKLNKYELEDLDELAKKHKWSEINQHAYTSKGCDRCEGKGQVGKMAAFEILSFKHPHLNTPELINDAYNKAKLGIVRTEDLLNLA